jgi:hypothetical protein
MAGVFCTKLDRVVPKHGRCPVESKEERERSESHGED